MHSPLGGSAVAIGNQKVSGGGGAFCELQYDKGLEFESVFWPFPQQHPGDL